MKRYINTSPFHYFSCGGHGYHIYERGKDKVLVARDGHTHIWLCESKGCVAFYRWENSKWTPRLRWDDKPFADLKTEQDIINFITTHQQLW